MITVRITNGMIEIIEFDRKDEQLLAEFLMGVLDNPNVQFDIRTTG